MMSRKEINFYKLVGAGNDFVFLALMSSEKDLYSRIHWPQLAKKICDRHFGVGADGLVGLYLQGENKLKWDFYNADGSQAEMCGNAARCAFSLMFQLGKTSRVASLETLAGEILGEIQPDRTVTITLPSKTHPQLIEKTVQSTLGVFVDTGVPHFVIKTDDVNPKLLREKAAMLRNAPEFGKSGTNVTFLKDLGSGRAKAITFERGVEDFTLSCGTGALAAGAVVMSIYPNIVAEIEMPGGRLDVSKNAEGLLTLHGDAQVVFDGKLNPGVINGIF
jgi:diaminopimelate epimerase